MIIHSEFRLPELTRWGKKKMLDYASQVLEAQQQMSDSKGNSILHYTLKKKRRHESMIHYPKGDRIDHSTGAQYFYHCHRENMETTEHGHFHCFLRYKHIPRRVKPASLADWDLYLDNPMTHLIAISMNQFGQPIRLFTVNRWITSEIWYDAVHVSTFIKRFKMTLEEDQYWSILDKWVEGMLHLFAPQIVWLHQARDRQIEHYKNHSDNPYTDHQIEELSEISVDMKKQIEWIIS